MRLFLSSYRLGDRPEALRELVGSGSQALVVTNAWDASVESREESLARELEDLAAIGFHGLELDLREHFASEARLESLLAAADLIWVPGGNTFVLARSMRHSGFAALATRLLAEDRLVYGGYSAGACVVGAALDGCQLMDAVDELPDGYDGAEDSSPLGWIPWSLVPHFRSDHEEAPLAECAVELLLEKGLPFQTLRDGDVLIVNGTQMVRLGPR